MENDAADHGPQDSPEDLLVMLESLSHGRQPDESTSIYSLYQPVQQLVLMLLPDRRASEALVHFALSQLSWLHCGIRTVQFWEEHELFWDTMERGNLDVLKDHSWMAMYLGILAVGTPHTP